jgi:serine/threonine protein kinase
MDFDILCLGCFAESDGQTHCPYCGFSSVDGPESPHHLLPGTILEEQYIIGRVLGQGGFGITYLGMDLRLNLKLAIKEYFPYGLAARIPGSSAVDLSTGENKKQLNFGLERFMNEARTLARFENHPNIVTVRDYFETNATAYMVMNYLAGCNLEHYLHYKEGKIPFDQALAIFMPVLDALREVHRAGFMHRDISPDNIFITDAGQVILIDFGAARQEVRGKSKSLSVILKAGYAPEEQYRSRGKQGPWTDIYAVGSTLYRSITGKPPPEAMDRLAEDDLVAPSQLGVSINSVREEALLKALAVRAADRFQTVEEFQTAMLQDHRETEERQNKATTASATFYEDPHPVKSQPIRGEDIEKDILLSYDEAAKGTNKTIRVSINSICPNCQGTGFHDGSTCSECSGKGKQKRQKTISVKIPAGVKEGKRIRLKGQGGKGLEGGSDGDFCLLVKVEEHHEERSFSSKEGLSSKANNAAKKEESHRQGRSKIREVPSPKSSHSPDVKRGNRFIKYSMLIVFSVVLFFGMIYIFGDWPLLKTILAPEKTGYYFDYESGTIPLGDLPIGTRVIDPTWEWEYRKGINYSEQDYYGGLTEPGDLKPVAWIIVAKDHYDLDEMHVTLLAEELIGRFVFDNSSDGGHENDEWGHNHWGESGTANASRGLRPWLNSTDIHSGGGFYNSFSEGFKQALLATPVPNREWKEGTFYITSDEVFIPSTTEMGDEEHYMTYPIGKVYPLYSKARDNERIAMMVGAGWIDILEKEYRQHQEDFLETWDIYDNNWFYWTRSPFSQDGFSVLSVIPNGKFINSHAYSSTYGVRPALNLKADTLVSEIRD